MKILLVGSNGQLGKALQKILAGQKFLALDFPEIDIADKIKMNSLISDYKPQVVINAAAYTNVDNAESDRENAWKVNALGPQNLALACSINGAELVQVSTDYVFSGQNIGRAVLEYDNQAPISVYGQSKLAGERAVIHILPKSYIVRTAWLYGEGNNFVRTMLKLGREKHELKIVDDQIGSPTNANDLAAAIWELINIKTFGVYHIVNGGQTSWYGFAKKIFEITGNNIKLTTQTSAELNRPAPRPAWSVLDNSYYQFVTGKVIRPWQTALVEYLQEEN